MNYVKIFDALANYLYDKKFFIAFFDDNLYIYKYKEVVFLSTNKIIIEFELFNMQITGNDLIIIKMNNEELMIKGQINEIKKNNK